MGFDIITLSVALYSLNIFMFNCEGFVLNGEKNSAKMADADLSKDTVVTDFQTQQMTIGKFARHVLCKNYEGKRNLYMAMKQKACDISLSMIQRVVLDLCRRKDHMLNKWVEELFDIDGDGYISHYEKHYQT